VPCDEDDEEADDDDDDADGDEDEDDVANVDDADWRFGVRLLDTPGYGAALDDSWPIFPV
jgi:hypothetical protein